MKSNYASMIILAAMICGLLVPAFKIFEPILIILIAALIWISSLSVSPKDILVAAKKPYHHLYLLLICFLVLPVISWGIVSQLSLPPEIAAGYVLASMAPLAAATPFYTTLVKGDVALAMTFTASTLLLTPLAVPIMSYLLLNTLITVEITAMLKILIGIIFLPFILALLTRKIEKLKQSAGYLSLPLLFIILATLIAMNSEAVFTAEYSKTLLAIAFIQPLLNFVIAYAVTFSWSKREKIPFIFGLTIRNMALIMTLAALNFGAAAALPGTFIVLAHVIFALGFLLFFGQNKA